MKNLFISLLTLITGLSFSQELEKSLLWKISGNGLKHDSYLFGTIHITCDASIDENTVKALGLTEQLYLELDMDDNSMQKQMMSHIIMKDGTKLSTLLNAKNFKIVDDFLKKNINMSVELFDSFKPFVITTMLYPKMIDCSFQSIENELMKINKEQNKEVFGLESVEEQMKVFDNISYQIQAEELLKMAKSNLSKDKEEIKRMITIYQNKDIEGIQEIMDKSENKITSENKKILIYDRNIKWIPTIIKIINEKPTFIGVGAWHLAGNEGIIKLLRRNGYQVEAVVN